ncbi:hypothetical protein BDZ94DRAFT_1210078 [Collybia nuda]|uniref:Uncharacterized protein n=1 Tax=Collybia nuda TaxID=64659 RepID=A0A9P6CMW8_9AGAR|nr:hypothetical protein BDZ94DRAFT_1210078 [Collybia nuda]
MDEFYDFEAAKKGLVELATQREGEIYNALATTKMMGYSVQQFYNPTTWRIVKESDNPTAREECVLRLHGILSELDLPPVSRQSLQPKKQLPHLRQQVGITLLDSKLETSYMDKLLVVYHFLCRAHRNGFVAKWGPSEFRDYVQLNAHSRYFTSGNYAKFTESVPFRPMVDPDNALSNVSGTDLVHGTDNVVDYLRLVRETGQIYYEETNPASFRVGDIVELEISPMALGVKGNSEAKFTLILRSIIMLDDSHSIHATFARAKASMPRLVPAIKLIRKTASDEKEERDVIIARRGVALLNIERQGDESDMNITN